MNIKGFLKYHIKDRLVLAKKRIKLFLFKKNTPILIFTMAKVGSLSVYLSLKKIDKSTAYFHIHNLNTSEIKNEIKLCLDNGVYPGSRSVIPLINKKILQKNRDFKIITLFRDPVDRNLSAFFEAFEIYVGEKAENYTGSLQELENIYHNKLPHNYAINWFDNYLYPETKIDVYKNVFNKEDGFLQFKENNTSVLIINAAISDETKVKLIRDFSGISNFNLKNVNVTAISKAGNLYAEFKNFIKFDESYLLNLYNSKYGIHFFSEEHRIKSINKWKKK